VNTDDATKSRNANAAEPATTGRSTTARGLIIAPMVLVLAMAAWQALGALGALGDRDGDGPENPEPTAAGAMTGATAPEATPTVVVPEAPKAPAARDGGTATATPTGAAAGALAIDDHHSPTIPRELAALGASRYHLEQDEPEKALEQLDRLAERVAQPALSREHEATRVAALCLLGRRDEADALLAKLRPRAPARWPTMALIERHCAIANAAAGRAKTHEP